MTSRLDLTRGSLHRTQQFNLYADQRLWLEKRANEDGVTLAEVIRNIIDEAIARDLEAGTPEEETR